MPANLIKLPRCNAKETPMILAGKQTTVAAEKEKEEKEILLDFEIDDDDNDNCSMSSARTPTPNPVGSNGPISSVNEVTNPKEGENKMEFSQHEEQPMVDITKPHHHDVLCGRGVTTNRHPGNESFRRLVGLNKVCTVLSHFSKRTFDTAAHRPA